MTSLLLHTDQLGVGSSDSLVLGWLLGELYP